MARVPLKSLLQGEGPEPGPSWGLPEDLEPEKAPFWLWQPEAPLWFVLDAQRALRGREQLTPGSSGPLPGWGSLLSLANALFRAQ